VFATGGRGEPSYAGMSVREPVLVAEHRKKSRRDHARLIGQKENDQSPTGWARSSFPQTFGFSAWDGTGSICLGFVDNTNVPARVVVSLKTHRKNIYGLYDLVRLRLATMQGKHVRLNGDPHQIVPRFALRRW
jgi:hypothetical protein